MSEEIIKSGEEVVKEFFEKVKKDTNLDQKTREALYELFQEGNFRKTSIKRKLESIRDSVLSENDDEIKKDKN